MNAPPRLIALTDREVDGLFGIGPLGALIYLSLRAVMDYHDGTAGRSTPISLNGLAMACETHTTRGRGVQITRPSEKEVRGALGKLQRAGLLRRLPGDALAFRLPLALVASARPIQTGHSAGTVLSTQPGTVQPASTLVMQAAPGTDAAPQQRPNRAHIKVQENQTLPARREAPVDNRGSRPAADRSARGADVTHGARPPACESEQARLLAIGRQRGIDARPGESWSEFAARVFPRGLSSALS
ncbi:MAG: hypothetical protein E6R11_06075 [Rhodocyclaceae bacterium]|nr:MAG: hypothetical protein E6R11_06075 [Rhodocyclaceae bacterium]